MSVGKTGAEIAAGGLMGPAVADLVVDPASLDRLAGDASLVPAAAPLAALGPGAPGVPGAGEALVLSLADLLPDVEGTVVMLTDDTLPVSLVTDEPLSGSGVVGEPVSAGGLDVEGLYYYSFANGLTLYSDTDILIVSDSVGA